MRSFFTAFALTMTLWAMPAWALFESDKELAASARVTMQDAVSKALEAMPGKVVEAQIGKEEGRVVYEIKIIDTQEKKRTVFVDAQTGKTMKIER